MGQYQRNGRTTEWCSDCRTLIGFKMNGTAQNADTFKLCRECKTKQERHTQSDKFNNEGFGERNG